MNEIINELLKKLNESEGNYEPVWVLTDIGYRVVPMKAREDERKR